MKINNLLIAAILMMATALSGCAQNTRSDDDTVNIYFARHGKTLFNTFDRVQGWSDSPLTESGIEVAKYLGEGLKNIPFDSYYASDAGRQRETMEVILTQQGIHDFHLKELSGLREVFFGGFEGGFNHEMIESSKKCQGYPSVKTYLTAMKAGKFDSLSGIDCIAKSDPLGLAETSQQVKTRTQAALQTIIDNALKNNEKNVLAVSSGSAMQIMISDLTDNPAKQKPLPNAAVVKITYKNGQITVDEIGTMEYVNKGRTALTHQ